MSLLLPFYLEILDSIAFLSKINDDKNVARDEIWVFLASLILYCPKTLYSDSINTAVSQCLQNSHKNPVKPSDFIRSQ